MLAAAAGMVPAWLIVHYTAGLAGLPACRIPIAIAAAAAAAVTYLLLQFARGSEEMALLMPLPLRLRQSLYRRRHEAMASRPLPVELGS